MNCSSSNYDTPGKQKTAVQRRSNPLDILAVAWGGTFQGAAKSSHQLQAEISEKRWETIQTD